MKTQESYPGWRISAGDPGRMGVTKAGSGYNFTVRIPDEEEAFLLLFKKDNIEEVYKVPLPVSDRIGEISSVKVEPLNAGLWYYGYEAGHNYFLDFYAKSIDQIDGRSISPLVPGDIGKGCGIPLKPVIKTKSPKIPYEDSIIYKTNVRGFTMNHGSNTKNKGTFAGIEHKISYLKDLGITTLELMPVYEFYDHQTVVDLGQLRRSYWGYGPAFYFAPKASYASNTHAHTDQVSRFVHLVESLHREGMECILEFYFTPDVRPEIVLDILHYWRLTFGVDGFHLMGDALLPNHIAEDPLLKDTKLIYTGFDTASIYGENVKPSRRTLAEHNLSFEHVMRKFLKGDDGCVESAAYKLRRNPIGCGQINYFADHDGFTMADMVTYEQKHNEKNGENNHDGTDQNYTWNCGIEGSTSSKKIRVLRRNQMRNAWLMLMTAQGTPMINGGDENCNSSLGNNNPYCQDNLHQSVEPRLTDYKSLGCPDLSYHGTEAWFPQMKYNSKTLGIMYYGAYAKKTDGSKDESIYIALNMNCSAQKLALPNLNDGEVWKIVADTSTEDGFYPPDEKNTVYGQKKITIPPRTVMILTSGQIKKQGGN